MGADLLLEAPSLFERYVVEAERVSGLPLTRFCLEGPLEELTRTDVAQPAIFAVSLALAEHAAGLGIRPRIVAGHSLGEYTAAVAAGTLSFAQGLELVCLRGRLMASIQATRPGAMAAIIGLGRDDVERLCAAVGEYGVAVVANENTPLQTVVSGEVRAIERILELAAGAGAEQTARLNAGAAFHSPLMEPVQQELARALADAEVRAPRMPLVGNASGRALTTTDELLDELRRQTVSPVRWVDSVRTMLASGVRTFLELGPGRVLTGLVRQIDPTVDAVAADSPRRLESQLARATAGHGAAGRTS
jgi:[acyl-carrier-protein] S-malonyltransferase